MIRTPIVALTTTIASGLFLLAGSVAHAAEPSVTISSPQEGETLDVMEQNKIVYEVVPGPDGDHVHVYVDDEEVGILRQLEGSHTFESLPEGEHELCIKVVNKAHVPIGVDQCVNVNVE